MGLCIDCKFHEEKDVSYKENKNGRIIFLPRGHYCNNKEYTTTDFVTGECFYANCYQKNAFGECLLFTQKQEDGNPDNENEENPPENPDKGN